MSISVLDTNLLPSGYETFPSSPLLYVDDSISVSPNDLRDNTQSSLAEAVFFSYSNLHQILGQARISLSNNNAGPAQTDQLQLNSRIVSLSLGRAGRHLELKEPARVSLRHLRENLTEPICVFWDFEEHSWSDSGCRVAESNATFTVCECDHLTNFAVLMRDEESGVSGAGGMLFGGRVDIFGSIAAAVLLFLILLVIIMVREQNILRPMLQTIVLLLGEWFKMPECAPPTMIFIIL